MTEPPSVALFVSGGLSAGFAVAALFFLKFWMRTRDLLFAAFAGAFLLMAANQAVAGFAHANRGEAPPAYVLRLAAFALIILAILAKNGGDQLGSPGAPER